MYKLVSNVSFEIVENCGFIVNVDSGKIFSINRTATIIVSGIVAGLRISDIKNQISNEFDVEIEKIETDINRYLELLLLNGIIEEI